MSNRQASQTALMLLHRKGGLSKTRHSLSIPRQALKNVAAKYGGTGNGTLLEVLGCLPDAQLKEFAKALRDIAGDFEAECARLEADA